MKLDLDPYVRVPPPPSRGLKTEEDSHVSIDKRSIYQCCGVVNHHGSYGGGHYTAYIRDPSSGMVFLCDDDLVEEVEEEDMASSQAYLLLYRRCMATAIDN